MVSSSYLLKEKTLAVHIFAFFLMRKPAFSTECCLVYKWKRHHHKVYLTAHYYQVEVESMTFILQGNIQEYWTPLLSCPCCVTLDMSHSVGSTLGWVPGDKDESVTCSEALYQLCFKWSDWLSLPILFLHLMNFFAILEKKHFYSEYV